MLRAIPATWMRGGTSKGLFLDAAELPKEPSARDRVLLAAMGSPDARQIDGVGGAHPLTSKVAVISRPTVPVADVDYLFLQVAVDRAEVSAAQNCGNILAGVGPWAIENGFVRPADPVTPVRIHMLNTASIAIAHVPTAGGVVEYSGATRIDGVPGTGAAIRIDFVDIAGSSCGSLFPTGQIIDDLDGLSVTCIDHGMPVVIMRASDFGLDGTEPPADIERRGEVLERIERLRLMLGPRMNLGDVTKKTVPKMTLVSTPRAGGTINTRSLIPHRVHEAIGVLGAVSVATACAIPGSVAATTARGAVDTPPGILEIEHPSGSFTVEIDVRPNGAASEVRRAALVRTARKLMRGEIFVPAAAWEPA